jgi:hypothetical protein
LRFRFLFLVLIVDSALEIAIDYSIDADIVFKAKCLRMKEDCVKDLSQITDLPFVLEYCTNRIPNSPDISRGLLEFGLGKTESITEKSVNSFVDDLLNGISQQESSVDRILHYRIMFLKYLDRLQIYSRIYPQPHASNYSLYSQQFRTFRDSNVVDLAMSFALECNYSAVKILLQSFPEVSPYRYDILASFPESVDPRLYEDIFYESFSPLRENDWSENDSMREFAGISIHDLPIVGQATDIALADWFIQRSIATEALSGQGSPILSNWQSISRPFYLKLAFQMMFKV